jgi:hypothetical protein
LVWLKQRLFRRQNRGLLIAFAISIFIATGAPFKIWDQVIEQRCRNACAVYMRGEANARWVAPYANGAGYSALLTCMQASVLKQESYDCWEVRVHACAQACLQDPDSRHR